MSGLNLQPPASTGQTHPTAVAKTCGIAKSSMILGILSVFVPVILGIPAIICGHISRSKIRKSAGSLDGSGMAIAGLVLGYGSFVIMVPLIGIVAAIAIPAISSVGEKAQEAANKRNAMNLISVYHSSIAAGAEYQDLNGNDVVELSEVISQLLSGIKGSGHFSESTFFVHPMAKSEVEAIQALMSFDLESGNLEFSDSPMTHRPPPPAAAPPVPVPSTPPAPAPIAAPAPQNQFLERVTKMNAKHIVSKHRAGVKAGAQFHDINGDQVIELDEIIDQLQKGVAGTGALADKTFMLDFLLPEHIEAAKQYIAFDPETVSLEFSNTPVPVQASTPDLKNAIEASNRRNAMTLVSIHRASMAAGAEYEDLNGDQALDRAEVLYQLLVGVQGGGNFSGTTFQASGMKPGELQAAEPLVTYDPATGVLELANP